MTNPSGRSGHWAVVRKERAGWKAKVLAAIGPAKPAKPFEKATLTLTRRSSVAPDPDGLVSGFKAIVDALVDHGVIVNDRFNNIGMPDYRWEKAPPGKGHVVVRVVADTEQ